MIGTTLGHYHIVAELGTGGMGKVYRATDLNLGRPVAIKVLLPAAVADPERRKRFSQEARTASGLQHPNIVAVYDVGAAALDGQTINYLVMELAEGRTLDKLIARKGLNLVEALRYGVQVAGALAAAHTAGIVHRDLKPANLMVSDSGQVKVLDFGLAKLTEMEPADAFAATESVQIDDSPKTEVGTIVGTVAYMSPEQAEGKRLDGRSDLFSLGVVLYEMITGQPPFTGHSKISVLSGIIHKEVLPLSAVVQDIPREVERVVGRCLRKDPAKRWQTAGDLKVALEELAQELESGSSSVVTTPIQAPAPPAPPPAFSRRALWPAIAGLAVAAPAGWWMGRKSGGEQQIHYQRLTFRRGDIGGARFAPDGQTVIYTAAWDGGRNDIFQARIGNRESRSLGFPEARIAAVSPAGELAILIGQFAGQVSGFGIPATLARVPMAGGAPREVLDDVSEADWAPGGVELVVGRRLKGRYRIEYPIGKVLYETDSPRPPSCLRFSPDGKYLAFFDYDAELGDLVLTAMTLDGKRRPLSKGWRGVGRVAWSPSGNEIWFSGSRLGTDPLISAVTLEGRERVLAYTQGWMVLHDVGKDGSVLASSQDSRIAILCQPPGETRERDLSWFDTSYLRELSRDGKLLLFNEIAYGAAGNIAIYLRKTDGSPAVRLGEGARPTLSPDGRQVACIHNEGKRRDLMVIPTGAGEGRVLTTPGFHYENAEWFPDGERLLVVGSETEGDAVRTFVQDLKGGKPVAATPAGVRGHCVSPDQSTVLSVENGKLLGYQLAGGGSPPRVICPAEPGDVGIRWSRDGESLFLQHIGLDQPFIRIYRIDLASGRKDVWKEIRPADPVGVTMGPAWVTPNGDSYAYTFYRDLGSLFVIRGLQ